MNRLKELRKEKKLSQKQIALELDTPLRTYQRWENDETQIKPDKAQMLADYFGVPVGYLLGYDEISDPFLNEIADDLNKQLTTDEKEHLKKYPELNEYYLGLAWDRMLKKQDSEILERVNSFNEDFINLLKYHDLYLSNSEIEKVMDIMYLYSKANNVYLSILLKEKNLGEFEKIKNSSFSKLFEYSSLWQLNYDGLKKQIKHGID